MTTNFLDTLWPAKPDAYLSTWMKTSGAVKIFHTSEFERASDYMIANAKYDDVYFTVGLLSEPPTKGRGAAKDIGFLSCLHADFDLLNDNNVHAKSALPTNSDELRGFLDELSIPTPSIMVNSGNGIHAYWLMEQPLKLDSEDARKTAAGTLKGFQQVIIAEAQRSRGWKFDNTGDLARVLRFPGTLNHKTDPAKQVEIIR